MSLKTPKKSSPPSANKQYYPAFLDISGRSCVIIGGGKVAERKAMSLLRLGASVTVVSPGITQTLKRYRDKGLLDHVKRNYRKRDIHSAFVVIVATDSEETNRRVAADATRARVLLNVVDNPALCSFIVPSVVQRGPLTIAVSTAGVSPALARTIRKELEGMFGTEFSEYLKFVRGVRKKALTRMNHKPDREAFLKELASDATVAILRKQGFRKAKETVLRKQQALLR
jgi:precorrin-2 dehydrogenase/sirohydrochlorin ferrochelatase